MVERNLCHESGCPDLCCINKGSRFSPEEIEANFPNARRYVWDEEIRDLDKGVAILGGLGTDGRYLVFVKGKCPHNTVKGCSAPAKPLVCKMHKFAGERCNSFRKYSGLIQIDVNESGHIPW